MKHLFRFNTKSLGILALALMLPLSINPVEAGNKHCDNPNSTHPSCSGDGDGDSNFIQTNSPNWVIWGSLKNRDGKLLDWDEGLPYETNYHDDTDDPNPFPQPRFCGGSNAPQTNPNPQGGLAYVCHQQPNFLYGRDNWNVVYMDLSFLKDTPELLEKSGREQPLCNRLLAEPGVVIAPKRDDPPLFGTDPYPGDPHDDPVDFGRLYSYYISMDPTWNEGPCVPGKEDEDGFCYVKIAINGNFYNECRGNKCRRYVNIEAWGHVEPNPGDDQRNIGKIEINPFTLSQWIEIEELTVNFRDIGGNKIVASCYYDNREYDQGGNIISGVFREDIFFRTRCDGDSCYQAPVP